MFTFPSAALRKRLLWRLRRIRGRVESGRARAVSKLGPAQTDPLEDMAGKTPPDPTAIASPNQSDSTRLETKRRPGPSLMWRRKRGGKEAKVDGRERVGEKGKNGKWEEEEGRKGKSKLNFDAGKMGEGGETVCGGGFKIASPAKMFFRGKSSNASLFLSFMAAPFLTQRAKKRRKGK